MTKVINIFGAPGAGKSTCASYIFARLKMAGIDCEYVSEFAKDKVWEDNKTAFKYQLYLSAKQSYKVFRCSEKVDFIITDSPIITGTVYDNRNPYLKDTLFWEFNQYDNINIYLKRNHPYVSNGRNQTEEESDEIADAIKEMLDRNNVKYVSYNGSEDGYNSIVDHILKLAEEQKVLN